jgi:hypothetical protein
MKFGNSIMYTTVTTLATTLHNLIIFLLPFAGMNKVTLYYET